MTFQHTQLSHLTLANCNLDDDDAAAVVAGLAWRRMMLHVSLARNRLTDHVLSVVQVLMTRCRHLQLLDIVRFKTYIVWALF